MSADRARPGVEPDTPRHTPGGLLDAEQLAERWRVPTSWVYAQTRAGALPCVKLGRYRRYRVDKIEAFELAGGLDG